MALQQLAAFAQLDQLVLDRAASNGTLRANPLCCYGDSVLAADGARLDRLTLELVRVVHLAIVLDASTHAAGADLVASALSTAAESEDAHTDPLLLDAFRALVADRRRWTTVASQLIAGRIHTSSPLQGRAPAPPPPLTVHLDRHDCDSCQRLGVLQPAVRHFDPAVDPAWMAPPPSDAADASTTTTTARATAASPQPIARHLASLLAASLTCSGAVEGARDRARDVLASVVDVYKAEFGRVPWWVDEAVLRRAAATGAGAVDITVVDNRSGTRLLLALTTDSTVADLKRAITGASPRPIQPAQQILLTASGQQLKDTQLVGAVAASATATGKPAALSVVLVQKLSM